MRNLRDDMLASIARGGLCDPKGVSGILLADVFQLRGECTARTKRVLFRWLCSSSLALNEISPRIVPRLASPPINFSRISNLSKIYLSLRCMLVCPYVCGFVRTVHCLCVCVSVLNSDANGN